MNDTEDAGMRLGTAIANGRERVVAQRDGALHALDVDERETLVSLIARGGAADAPVEAAPLRDAQLTVPVRPGKIVAIGLNYLDHVRESGMEVPQRPLVFAKFPSSLLADGEAIVIDRAVTERVDWEVELAVVVGRRMRRVSVADALSHVFGYTVANDVSARDVQFADGQWVRGKSLDTFCPLGPFVVTADAVPDPQALALTTRVNGEVVQESSTREMVFGVAELLSFCSHSFTLQPGDVLLTGTPWGCGEFMDPVRSLRGGDTVEVAVESIGTLRNPVAEVSA
jgi:2-keto-4-pentenoate hydratase/2-oxohepta-3-ene-1,7-dioic acid hydratase in catechol pathway